MACENVTRLEDLPDELLLLICRYLDVVEILHCFSCLNGRLSKTIVEFSEHIDLSVIPSKLINRFRSEIFPDIGKNVRSIELSDDTERFCIQWGTFDKLESVHFKNFCPQHLLPDIRQIKFDLVPVDLQADLISRFFSSDFHSNLRSLVLNSFHGLTIANAHLSSSTRIEDLTITLKNNLDMFLLLSFLAHSVERLSIHILYNGPFKPPPSLVSPLKLTKLRDFHLKTTFEDSIKFTQLETLISESFPDLKHLSIETLTRDPDYIDGFRWQTLLEKLVLLTKFSFSIRYRFKASEQSDLKLQENHLLSSFSTDFWLQQRQWFVNYYSTCSTASDHQPASPSKRKNYEKLFLHTVPFPFPAMDATIDVMRSKSTAPTLMTRSFYANVRQLYYDGECTAVTAESLKKLFRSFKSVRELKLDRLMVGCPADTFNKINFPRLHKLTVYNTNEKAPNLSFLDLSSMHRLRFIRLPQTFLPDYTKMPRRIETLVLADCRDLRFDFVDKYERLRTLKLYLNNFDRLLENGGTLIMHLIMGVYGKSTTLETLQLMCHGANQTKVKLFERQFRLNGSSLLKLNYDGKSLLIQRSLEYFCH